MEEALAQFSSLRPSHQLTGKEWVIVDVTSGQAVYSQEEQTQDQGTHPHHPQGAVERKTKSGRPGPF